MVPSILESGRLLLELPLLPLPVAAGFSDDSLDSHAVLPAAVPVPSDAGPAVGLPEAAEVPEPFKRDQMPAMLLTVAVVFLVVVVLVLQRKCRLWRMLACETLIQNFQAPMVCAV